MRVSVTEPFAVGSVPTGGRTFQTGKNQVAKRQARPAPARQHRGMLESLASLGLQATASQMQEALKRMPEEGTGLEERELIRRGLPRALLRVAG